MGNHRELKIIFTNHFEAIETKAFFPDSNQHSIDRWSDIQWYLIDLLVGPPDTPHLVDKLVGSSGTRPVVEKFDCLPDIAYFVVEFAVVPQMQILH